MADYQDLDFFSDLSLVDNPYPFFEHLREQGPVTRLPSHNVIAVTGFEEALSVHLDAENFSAVNSVTGPLPPIPFVPDGDDITAQIELNRPRMPFGEDVLTLDQPRHTPLRSLMMRLFTPRRLREMEALLTTLSDQLIDEIADCGECEFVSAYATPFSTLAIAELLGVPDEDRAAFRKNSGSIAAPVGPRTGSVINPMEFRHTKFTTYITDRRNAPQSDILSDLANATYPDGSTPAVGDVVKVATLLFGAGQDTTATLLGNAMRIIAERPDLQGMMRADPDIVPDFLEEVLRISGPVKSTYRLARRATSVGGVPVPIGTNVMIGTAAANRDPRKFNSPAEFMLGRQGIKEHLSFGRGIHTCPGAALARTEARISLQRILTRLSNITIDAGYHGFGEERSFAYVPTYVFRTLEALNLRYEPAPDA